MDEFVKNEKNSKKIEGQKISVNKAEEIDEIYSVDKELKNTKSKSKLDFSKIPKSKELKKQLKKKSEFSHYERIVPLSTLEKSLSGKEVEEIRSCKSMRANGDSDSSFLANLVINDITDKAYKAEKKKITKQIKEVEKDSPNTIKNSPEEKKELIEKILYKADNIIDDSNKISFTKRLENLEMRDLKNIDSFLSISKQKYEKHHDDELYKSMNKVILKSNGKIKKINSLFEEINNALMYDDSKHASKLAKYVTDTMTIFKNKKLQNDLEYLEELREPSIFGEKTKYWLKTVVETEDEKLKKINLDSFLDEKGKEKITLLSTTAPKAPPLTPKKSHLHIEEIEI
jgi:hypothetical protein